MPELKIRVAKDEKTRIAVSKLRLGDAIKGLAELSLLLSIPNKRLDDIIDGKDLPSVSEVNKIHSALS